MWFVYALLSGICNTVSSLVARHILKGAQDAWAFSFLFSFFGAIVSLPFLLLHPTYAHSGFLWLVLFGVGILIVIHNLFNFKSTNYLEATLQGAISKIRLVWVLVAGIVFFHESFTLYKIIGTVCTVLGGIIIVMRNIKVPKSGLGILYSFLATFFYATVIMLYKFLFKEFNSQTLTFFIFLVPAVINLVIMPHGISRILSLFRNNPLFIILACVSGGLANLAMNEALALGDSSKVLVLIESFLIIVLVGEHILLKERRDLAIKLLAVLLATGGAICIRLSP